MVDYKQILQLRAEGVSQRGIAEVLGCSRNTVSAVFAAATEAGMGFGEVADLAAEDVRRLLLPERTPPESDRVPPDFAYVHRELGRPSVTLLLLWNEYVATCRESGGVPYRYSYFNEQYRRWMAATGATMRVPRTPGEAIEVDWAGDPMSYADPLTGQLCTAWLFVAALPYSAYTYVEAFPDMTLGSWIQAHVHAFEFFGGSARLLIPDNLRAGVTKADRYEPVLNPAYAQLAEHYGTAIVPARIKTPRDKPVFEGSVRFVANQVAAELRNRRIVGLVELNDAIVDHVETINARGFQKRRTPGASCSAGMRPRCCGVAADPVRAGRTAQSQARAELSHPDRPQLLLRAAHPDRPKSRRADHHHDGGGLRRRGAGGQSPPPAGGPWPILHRG